MILTQILRPNCVKAPLESRNKEAVIAELVDLLDANGLLSDRDVALQAVMTRERMLSTGTGEGIALPHGRCKAVSELVMAIGIAREPIDFENIDGKPVTIVILLVSPVNGSGPQFQALAKISRLMLDKDFKRKLKKAACAEEVYELLSHQEKRTLSRPSVRREPLVSEIERGVSRLGAAPWI